MRKTTLALAIALATSSAIAGGKHEEVPTPMPAPTITTEANAASASDALAEVIVSSRHSFLSLGSTAPIPIQPVDCWKPKEGLFKRGTSWLKLFEISALAEWDENCVAHSKELLQLQLELSREQNRRIKLEIEYLEVTGK